MYRKVIIAVICSAWAVACSPQRAKLVVHVEGKPIDGRATPLQSAQIYLSEAEGAHEHHHHHPKAAPVAVTDAQGDVSISVIADKEYVVHIDADGHDGVVRIVKQTVDSERNIWVTLNEEQKKTILVPRTGEIKVTLGSTAGGSVEPVTLTIEAGDLATDNGNGDPVDGEVEITYGSWDPAVDDPTSLPSDLRTADEPLVSYGMFHVEFRQGRETLNVRKGQTIGWTMQINEAMQDMATSADGMGDLNIYSLDHNSGLWVEDEVVANYNVDTGVMTTESTHFSHKNCDQPPPFPARSCVIIEVIDQEGNAVPQADTVITGRGPAVQGCNRVACTLTDEGGTPIFGQNNRSRRQTGTRPISRQVTYTVTARAHTEAGYWVQGQTTVETKCDDVRINCRRHIDACATATVVLDMNGPAIPPSAPAPGDDPGACQSNGDSCGSSDECCDGLVCSDYQCFAP